ncbi:MAG: ethanolamine ammonia-lyase reactivating factor EutA [Chloroflexi bacterium]|nr:ethanolamine ammonia-lyase reactivating factor EutA [Chloroflexota bacterium]
MGETGKQAHDHSAEFAGLHSHDGGAPHWHDEFGEHLAEDLDPEEFAARELDWQKHNVQIVTVGVDIGSSTSHLMFSKIFMQLLGEGSEVRSVVVGREIIWQSPVILTPYGEDNTIDAVVLQEFVAEAYTRVGATSNEVDSGVVILTGEALKRQNARAIAELFAIDSGKFVCATAGHHLEAVLAANGSGAVSRSRRDQQTLLNVDIGGGTTKLALVRNGEILGTAAVAIGARLLVKEDAGRLTRIDQPGRLVAERLGISLALGDILTAADETRIVQTWTEILAGLIERRPPEGLAAELLLTAPLPTEVAPQAIVFSGGVSEFIFLRETGDFGDLGKPLAKAVRNALSNGTISLPAIIDPNLGIRATAIGASLFTVQVGINPYVSDESVLPLLNVPVLVPKVSFEREVVAAQVAAVIHQAMARADLNDGEQPVALSLQMPPELDSPGVRALAEGIRDGLPQTIERSVPFVLLANESITLALGAVLKGELGIPGELIALEGVSVAEFDFIDVAPIMHPAEVVPVTIKSLLFAGGLDRRSVKQALRAAQSRG